MDLGKKVVLNASALAAGRLVMAAVSVVTLGISTRYLGLSGYGQLATATAFIAIVGSLNDLGISTIGARELARRPDETDHVIGGILTVGFLFSLLGGATTVALAFALYGGGENHLIREAILLLLLTVPLSAPFGAIGAYFRAQQKAYMSVIGALAGSVVTLALVATAALLDLGFTGVVLAYVIAAVGQFAVMAAFAWGKVHLRPSLDLRLCKQLLRSATPLGGMIVLGSIYWRIDIILLSRLSSAAEVALYAFVFKLVDMVMGLPPYIHITVMPELARVAGNRERFDEIMQKICDVLVVGAVGIFVLLVAFADELTLLAGGSAFERGAPVLQILAFAVLLAWIASMFGDAFLVHDKQRVSFFISLLALPANVVLNVLLIPLWGARGAAVAWVASELLILAAYILPYRRFFDALPRLRRGPQILAAACAMAAVALMKLLPAATEAGPILVLTVGGTLSALVYCLSLYAFKAMPPEIHENLVLPLWSRLKPALSPKAKAQ